MLHHLQNTVKKVPRVANVLKRVKGLLVKILPAWEKLLEDRKRRQNFIKFALDAQIILCILPLRRHTRSLPAGAGKKSVDLSN